MAGRPDRILGGAIRLTQPPRGFRAGMDSALLAAACQARAGERVLEAGCGPGAALLAAAARNPEAEFVGIERDPEALALAQGNIAANGLGERVAAQPGDVGRPFAELRLPRFDLAIANPPFFDEPQRLRAPAPERRAARVASEALPAWIDFLLSSVRDRAHILLIHRADRLADILAAMAARAGSVQVRPAQPFPDAPASRVLVRARKGGRAPLQLLPPLVLHERGGAKHSPEAEAILRGSAALPWPA